MLKRFMTFLSDIWHAHIPDDIFNHHLSPRELLKAIEAEEDLERYGRAEITEVFYRARMQMENEGVGNTPVWRTRRILGYAREFPRD